MGSIRRRGPASWLLDFYAPTGERQRPTIRVATRAEAERELKRREGELARGRPLFVSAGQVKFENLTQLVIRDYEINGKRSIGKTQKSVERLIDFFGGRRAISITAADVGIYIEKRLRTGLANASLNRELACLRRAFRLAVKAKLLSHDHVPMPQQAWGYPTIKTLGSTITSVAAPSGIILGTDLLP